MAFLSHELRASGLADVDAEIAAALLLNGLTGVVALWRAKRMTRPVAVDRFVAIAMSIVAGLGHRTPPVAQFRPSRAAIVGPTHVTPYLRPRSFMIDGSGGPPEANASRK